MRAADGACYLSCFLIAPLITGIFYINAAYNHGHTFQGILKSAKVYSSGGNTDKAYFVHEIFYKGPNTNDTCFVERPTTYHVKSKAEHRVEQTKLGTVRTIYELAGDRRQCIDSKIQIYDETVGFTLLSFFFCPWVIVGCYYVYKCCQSVINCSERNRVPTIDPEAEVRSVKSAEVEFIEIPTAAVQAQTVSSAEANLGDVTVTQV